MNFKKFFMTTDDQIKNLEDTIGGLNTTVSTMQGVIDKQNAQIENLEDTQGGLNATIATLNAQIASLKGETLKPVLVTVISKMKKIASAVCADAIEAEAYAKVMTEAIPGSSVIFS